MRWTKKKEREYVRLQDQVSTRRVAESVRVAFERMSRQRERANKQDSQ